MAKNRRKRKKSSSSGAGSGGATTATATPSTPNPSTRTEHGASVAATTPLPHPPSRHSPHKTTLPSPREDPPSIWTVDHALIGQVELRGKVLAPLAPPVRHHDRDSQNRTYPSTTINFTYGGAWEGQVVNIAAFAPEDPQQRRPALWRGLLPPPSSSSLSLTNLQGTSTVDVGDASLPLHARAIDCVSSDLTNRAFELYPVPSNVTHTGERLFRTLYHSVVNEHLPNLLLAAACEEIQAQYLKQYAQQQQQQQQNQTSQRPSTSSQSKSGKGSAAAQSVWSYKPPEYYSKPPSAYLVAPTIQTPLPSSSSNADTGASSQLQFPTFTPSQLANRIKHGCALAWKHYTESQPRPLPPPPPPPAPAPTGDSHSPLLDDPAMTDPDRRRSSTRIARQPRSRTTTTTEDHGTPAALDSTDAPVNHRPDNNGDGPSPYWKVVPGGKVAFQLHQTLLQQAPSLAEGDATSESTIGAPITPTTSEVDASLQSTTTPLVQEKGAGALSSAGGEANTDPQPMSSHSGGLEPPVSDPSPESLSSKAKVTNANPAATATAASEVLPEAAVEPLSSDMVTGKPDATAESSPTAATNEAPSTALTPRPKEDPLEDKAEGVVGTLAAQSVLEASKEGKEREAPALAEHSDAASASAMVATTSSVQSPDAVGDRVFPDQSNDGPNGQQRAADVEKAAAAPVPQVAGEQKDNADSDRPPPSPATSPEKPSDDDDDEEADEDEDFVPAADDDMEEDGDDSDRPRYVQENVKQLVQEAAALRNPPSEKSPGDPLEEDKGQNNQDEHDAAEDEEVDEAEVDEDVDLVLKNPFLAATPPAVLEFLGRKTAKLLTVSDLQEIIPSLLCKSKKKKAKRPTGIPLGVFATDVDREIWQAIDPSLALTPQSHVALQLTAEYEDEGVGRWETSYFGRTPLTVCLLDSTSRVPRDDSLAEDLVAQYKERKVWDSWRYKCVHGGYTVWPSWVEAVRRRRGSAETDQPRAQVPTNGESYRVPSTSGAAMAPHGDFADMPNDFVVAQALAQQEAASGGEVTTRRTTRRGGDTGGVFYGNQSNMTQRQLMGTLLRLISEKGFQTAASLLASVPDESSDPMRRIRGALGKLLWRRNQIAQTFVQCEWTDGLVQKHLRTSPLQSLAELDGAVQDNEATALTNYLQSLHETELRLRALVLKHLTAVPVVIVATAADERPGSLDAMDSSYFADGASIQWSSAGHAMLGCLIYRPSLAVNAEEHVSCRWYRVTAFCESVASTPTEEDGNPLDRLNIGNAKEATTMERRMRFKAAPVRSPSESLPTNGSDADSLVLTQAQVHAGAKAAELEQSAASLGSKERERNPFADGSNPQVTLFPADAKSAEQQIQQQIHGIVAGHDTSVDEDGKLLHRVLVVPHLEAPSNLGSAVWVRMEIAKDGALQCYIDGHTNRFSIQQFDYHSSSPAFRECQSIVHYLQRHPKAGPFLQPVDPIALKIPQYRDVVKNPMDISTLAQKLERGQYSNISPGQTTGLTPISRMLNGPFRNDVELIFDNAMLFNPPDDWIYMAAAAIKKAVVKKIEQVALSADQKAHGRAAASKSIYVDEDSDVDMYVYESDGDDDYAGSARRKRKRSAAPAVLKEDTSMRVMERPHRLQKILSESTGLRGPLADFPVNGSAGAFTLPPEWTCRRRAVSAGEASVEPVHRDMALEELLLLQQQMEETEGSGQRRSTRFHDQGTAGGTSAAGESSVCIGASSSIEFVPQGPLAAAAGPTLPTNRTELELERERLHEEYFAKLWRAHRKLLVSQVPEDGELSESVGTFADGSFPPYLGRVVPAGGSAGCVWEIREPFAVVALRWVVRGLVRSEHLTETEALTADSLQSGAVMINNVYTISEGEPFEELDVKELTRRKRADQEAPPSEDEVELSEYEKQRLERVARNAERLKALGLG